MINYLLFLYMFLSRIDTIIKTTFKYNVYYTIDVNKSKWINLYPLFYYSYQNKLSIKY